MEQYGEDVEQHATDTEQHGTAEPVQSAVEQLGAAWNRLGADMEQHEQHGTDMEQHEADMEQHNQLGARWSSWEQHRKHEAASVFGPHHRKRCVGWGTISSRRFLKCGTEVSRPQIYLSALSPVPGLMRVASDQRPLCPKHRGRTEGPK